MWQELGIEPTADPKAIRAAYARRLKDIDPERDPEAFQRLRQAYEAAIASLAQDGQVGMPAAAAPRVAAPPPARRAEAQLAPEEATHPVLVALDRALAGRDAQRALALLEEAVAKGLVPLAPSEDFIGRLLDVVVADTSLPAETFARVIRRFGWDAYFEAVSRPPPPPLVARAIARLSAAAWFARLRDAASMRRVANRLDERTAARLMLGDRRPILFMDNGVKRRLRAELEQFDRYEPFLAGRLDPDRLRWLRWAVTEEAARREARKLLCFWIAVTWLLVAAALLPGY